MYVYREIDCIMSCLRIADIYTVKEYCYLIACTSSHTDISLGTKISTLTYIYACHIFQKIIDTLHRE